MISSLLRAASHARGRATCGWPGPFRRSRVSPAAVVDLRSSNMIGRRLYLLAGCFLLAAAAYGAYVQGTTEAARETLLIVAVIGVGFMLGAVAMAIVEFGANTARKQTDDRASVGERRR
ncbi:hypothetical protein FAF44_30910 [Nonomuraea sp. MG754425]|uniref:hypothetical protein n=1 Tax=Nonomuraea sp. MG754425 TaxID=2570319 RepID=UPI001F2B16EF|nr:hypothetical protein [Nonomuraea sp. MG754425]MCF6472775.1 hypothetical protein [Nonomuraea sp. MG754425]